MKIISIVGARPQFIKLAPIVRELRKHQDRASHLIIHTGQHYDDKMSADFFTELELPEPHYNLAVGSGTHAEQTGKGLKGIETIALHEKPDHVIVFGDTNATLSGVLAASKLNIPISHIEAGLRSYNRSMPEEINRIIADRLSTYLFCPDDQSVMNLVNEGINHNLFNVGDVMVDQLHYVQRTLHSNSIKNPYIFMTLHRQETSNTFDKLEAILLELNKISDTLPVIFPVHPRMRAFIKSLSMKFSKNFNCIDPLGYRHTIEHIKNAQCVITDSGGIQKESYVLKTPCITLRTETEWVDTLINDWNTLVAFDLNQFRLAFNKGLNFEKTTKHFQIYGNGHAAKKIINQILK
jgi:UDP-GlcNAc3NAcA epimerase